MNCGSMKLLKRGSRMREEPHIVFMMYPPIHRMVVAAKPFVDGVPSIGVDLAELSEITRLRQNFL